MRTVSIVLPAYNEEQRIRDTLEAVKTIEGIQTIIVVNDGSTDRTSELAREAGAEVIDLHPNRGKGGAMNAVVPHIHSDIVAFLDADLGASAGEAWKIIQPVVEGTVDLSIAAFPPPSKKGGFGLVKGTAAWAIQKTGKMEVNAPLSGQRAMTVEVLHAVTPFSRAYGVELGMTLRVLQKGFRVMEVPTTMSHNETGRDLNGFVHRGKQFWDVIRVVIKETGRKSR
ncbi:MAG: glycosyltransferase family 2 protein [Bacillota bacterium]|nr:glycosyltransferase family 2 protein [Bacillota bacterium]